MGDELVRLVVAAVVIAVVIRLAFRWAWNVVDKRSAPIQKWHWDGEHRTPVAPEDDPEWVEWSKRQDSTGS